MVCTFNHLRAAQQWSSFCEEREAGSPIRDRILKKSLLMLSGKQLPATPSATRAVQWNGIFFGKAHCPRRPFQEYESFLAVRMASDLLAFASRRSRADTLWRSHGCDLPDFQWLFNQLPHIHAKCGEDCIHRQAGDPHILPLQERIRSLYPTVG
jgi:hypothetical protein